MIDTIVLYILMLVFDLDSWPQECGKAEKNQRQLSHGHSRSQGYRKSRTCAVILL